MYLITELDRQNDSVLDTLIFTLWGVAANRGDLGLSGIHLIPKSPYLFFEGNFDHLPLAYKQYFDALQRYFKVLFEEFRGLRDRIDEFERMRCRFSEFSELENEKLKDSHLGIFERFYYIFTKTKSYFSLSQDGHRSQGSIKHE